MLCSILVATILCTPKLILASENESEILFNKIFGSTFKSTEYINLPIFINNKYYADSELFVSKKIKDVKIQKKELLKILSLYIENKTKIKLLKSLNEINDEFINLNWFIHNGMVAKYDAVKLQLNITIPINIKRIEKINLGHSDFTEIYSDKIYTSSYLSSYLNLYGNFKYNWNDPLAEKYNYKIAFESAVNINKWVIDSEFYYNTHNKNKLARGNITVVKDWIDKEVRTKLGDINSIGRGFLNSQSGFGFSIESKYDFISNVTVKQSHKKYFELKYDSTVIIRINKLFYKTLQLDAGRYDLSNFPLTTGVNDITLEIIDQYGRESVIYFPLFSYGSILKQGSHEFYYSILRPKISAQYYYDNNITVIANHRYGITYQHTLGASYQADYMTKLFSIESHSSASFGNFTTQAALSVDKNNGTSSALSLDFWYKNNSNSIHNPVWELAIDHWNRGFKSPGSPAHHSAETNIVGSSSFAINTVSYASIRHNINLKKQNRMQFSHPQSMQHQTTLYYRQFLNEQLSWDSTLNFNHNNTIKNGFSFNLNLIYTFGKRSQTLRYNIDQKNNSSQLTWSRRAYNNLEGLNAEIDIKKTENVVRTSGNLKYNTNRFENSLRHTSIETNDSRQITTEYSIATALVYSEGIVALSRPVQDSFAIISMPESLRNNNKYELIIDGNKESYAAKSDGLGSAVIVDINSYYPRTLNLDIPKLPRGYDIGTGYATLKADYHSGTLIALEGENQVLFQSQLIDEFNKPIALKSGYLIKLSADEKFSNGSIKKLFFTNRKGFFQINGLNPGKYLLYLIGNSTKTININIPKNTDGVVNEKQITL